MPRYIVTGRYSASALKGMIAKPSDREAAARAVVEAAGGRLERYFLTTGETDFSIEVTIDEVSDLIAGLMAAGASGAVEGFKTVQAFTTAEFTAMQEKAGEIAKAYSAP
ncbi:GYD domain-containing protein [Limimaricola pyoseonensis]|uniref:Uncharacterized protein, contains GYD domain n=1 Tax=Limimaricola pyoseonensis TaxID=521013 RepID=A0A1G7H2V9_9RHOB|nr:GYD domain-containing protein [Limimaricola pyoseonensis]SDE94758.1 Uncharacterized protein, contains GYD domain [Limimaricola pyoseonensis]